MAKEEFRKNVRIVNVIPCMRKHGQLVKCVKSKELDEKVKTEFVMVVTRYTDKKRGR